MQPPEIPIPPWASKPRREMPPSVLSPSFSRGPLPRTAASVSSSAADGDNGGAVSEHPCVELFEWWLVRVEGEDQKIAVAGVFERNQTVLELAPAPIAKRHEARVVETEDGVVLLIYGSLNLSRMRENGSVKNSCSDFHTGGTVATSFIPMRQTHTQDVPAIRKGYKTILLGEVSAGERLLRGSTFMSELLKNVKRMSKRKDTAFQESSHLPNGEPRFEEYTCDGGILTNENAAASNSEGEKHEAVCNEVDNEERYLTAGRALRERDGGDVETNASLVLTVERANDNGNKDADNAPPTSYQRAPVAPLKSKGCLRKSMRVARSKKAAVNEDMPTSVCLDVQNSSSLSNGMPRFEEYTCDDHIATNEKAACSNNDGQRDEAVCNEVNDVQIDLTVGRALRGRDDGDIETNASLELTVECANDPGNEKADNAPSTSDQATAAVSLKTKGCQGKSGQMLSEKAPSDEEMPTSVCIDVQNSSHLSNEIPRFEKNTCLGDIPTIEDAGALNDNSERCTAVPEEVNSMEVGLTVGRTIRERGHDDITTNVSLDPTVECTNDTTNEGADNTSLLDFSPKKQRSELEKLQGATRSPLTSRVPYAHESLLTRGKATPLSVSTPEALKLRKSRSGRVIVPTLDSGCQRIVYDQDGTIAAVIGLDSPSPKGSKLKTYARKKTKAEPAEASKLKTYARRKKRRSKPASASKLKTYARKKRRAEPAEPFE